MQRVSVRVGCMEIWAFTVEEIENIFYQDFVAAATNSCSLGRESARLEGEEKKGPSGASGFEFQSVSKSAGA